MAQIGSTSVTMDAIKQIINDFGGSAGNDLTTFFQSNDSNKWSKYKPVKWTGDFPSDSLDEWWRASDGLCGFTSASILFNDTTALVNAYKSGNTFVYTPPSGGSSTPMRLGDFRRYLSTAMPPILSFTASGQIYANNSSSSCTFTILGNGDIDTSYNLRMSDFLPTGFGSLSEFYFGVIVTQGTSVLFTRSKSSAIGTDANFTKSVSVKASDLNGAGNYTAYPVFVSPTGKRYIACPIGGVNFSVITSADASKVGWMANSGYYTRVGGNITFKGRLAYSKSYGGIAVQVQPYVMHSNGLKDLLGSYVSVTLPTTSATTGYYDFSTTVKASTQFGDVYWLDVNYGSNLANKDSIQLVENLDM